MFGTEGKMTALTPNMAFAKHDKTIMNVIKISTERHNNPSVKTVEEKIDWRACRWLWCQKETHHRAQTANIVVLQ